MSKEANDGTTADWYKLPLGATELKHLIWHKNMNAQVGEIFRSVYRLNDCPHSGAVRNLNKIIAYAEQELERLALLPPANCATAPGLDSAAPRPDKTTAYKPRIDLGDLLCTSFFTD